MYHVPYLHLVLSLRESRPLLVRKSFGMPYFGLTMDGLASFIPRRAHAVFALSPDDKAKKNAARRQRFENDSVSRY